LNKIGEVIEKESCLHISNEKQENPDNVDERVYHTLTRGWIANEIFRRADP